MNFLFCAFKKRKYQKLKYKIILFYAIFLTEIINILCMFLYNNNNNTLVDINVDNNLCLKNRGKR